MGILLVYDITDEASFNNIQNWMKNVDQHAAENVNKVCEPASTLSEQHTSPGLRNRSLSAREFARCHNWPVTHELPRVCRATRWEWFHGQFKPLCTGIVVVGHCAPLHVVISCMFDAERVLHEDWGLLSQCSIYAGSQILIGNKCDMGSDKRAVSYQRGETLAHELGIPFFETSAKDNINVEEAFLGISNDVLDRAANRGVAPSPDALTLTEPTSTSAGKRQRKQSCCS